MEHGTVGREASHEADHDASVADVPYPNFASDLRNPAPFRAATLARFAGTLLATAAAPATASARAPTAVTSVSAGNFDIDGALVGGTAGYNLQFGGFVLCIKAIFTSIAARDLQRRVRAASIRRHLHNAGRTRRPEPKFLPHPSGRRHRSPPPPVNEALTAFQKFGDGTAQMRGLPPQKSKKRYKFIK